MVCALFVAAAAMAQDDAYADELALFATLLGPLAIVWFIPSLIGGIGLLRRRPWARAVIWLQSPLLAFVVPVGTLLAGLNMWALLSTQDLPADGGVAKLEQLIRRFAGLVAAALVALALLGGMIGVGYVFRDVIDPPRPQPLTPMPEGSPPIVSRAPAG